MRKDMGEKEMDRQTGGHDMEESIKEDGREDEIQNVILHPNRLVFKRLNDNQWYVTVS